MPSSGHAQCPSHISHLLGKPTTWWKKVAFVAGLLFLLVAASGCQMASSSTHNMLSAFGASTPGGQSEPEIEQDGVDGRNNALAESSVETLHGLTPIHGLRRASRWPAADELFGAGRSAVTLSPVQPARQGWFERTTTTYRSLNKVDL